MKNFKKVVALSLAFLMVIAAVVVSPVTAKAEGETKGDLTFINPNLYNTSDQINIIANGYAPDVNWMAGSAADFGYWHGMVLEFQPTTGKWVVTQSHTPQGVANSALQTGKFGVDAETGVITVGIFIHDNAKAANEASFNFFAANNVVGKEFYFVGDFWAMIMPDGETLLDNTAISGCYFTTEEPADYFGKPADTTTDDDTTGDDTTTDEGTTDEEIKDTGDNFVPMFVVLFAGLALVTVATVARKRA